ncbi:hypothetical protein [Lacihabitans sp. LS3-19]|nr:hypothetical protein [Lacihabitans sp. LS3-19]
MKSKLALLVISGVLIFSSCKKQPCPAYGKVKASPNNSQIRA